MTMAIVGRTGSGKTYAAKGIVEGYLDAGERVCIIDPTGAWWGLRAPGAGPAFDVLILGGDHADVAITPAVGERLGDLVASGALRQSVIDISNFSGGEQTRFLTDLLEHLFTKNRGPLNLVMDEADVMAPQNPMPEQRRLQGTVNKIVRRGRIRGFRPVMITQRPAVLDKSVLSQIDTMIAMRLTAPQDRAAIQAWVKGSADAAEAAPVLESLAKLPTGEGWFWAPAEGVLERRRFPRIRSYDSSKSPEGGEAEAAVVAAPAALAEIIKALAPQEVQEQKKSAGDAGGAGASAADLAAAEKRGYDRGYAEGLERGERWARAALAKASSHLSEAMRVISLETNSQSGPPPSEPALITPRPVATPKATPKGTGQVEPSRPVEVSGPTDKLPPEDLAPGLTKPQARIMASLAFWASVGFSEPRREQVAAVAGYAPGSGNFNNLVGGLRAMGEVSYPTQGAVKLERPAAGLSKAQAAAALRSVLSGPQMKIVEALIAEPGVVPRERLASITDYAPGSGNFNNIIGSLRTLGMIDYPVPKSVVLEDWVRRVL